MRRIFQSDRFKRYLETSFIGQYFVRRQALKSFDLMAGFVYSQILLCCVKLDIFNFLKDGPKDIERVFNFLNLDKAKFDCLFMGASAIGLIEKDEGDLIDLTVQGHIFANDKGLLALILHHEMFYRDLMEPVAFLKEKDKETSLNRYWGYVEQRGVPSDTELEQKTENAKRYSELMAISQPLVTDQMFSAYDFTKHTSVLDVGGGKASFSIRLAKFIPGIKVANLDLPEVCEEAKKNVKQAGLVDAVKIIPSNFLEDEIPSGYDLVTLIRVLYDHSEENVIKLLQLIRKSLSNNGKLLIAEPMANNNFPGISCDAYFWFYLALMGKGRPRSSGELIALLRDCGFSKARCLKTTLPIQTGIVLAEA